MNSLRNGQLQEKMKESGEQTVDKPEYWCERLLDEQLSIAEVMQR